MPARKDISKILVIGSGPIIIGQACEFDYSGSQACKALKKEGYEVVLVNSNPATIMTDPEFADKTYIEPIDKEIVKKIIHKEKPDAILPTMGGQTALNIIRELNKESFFENSTIKILGASPRSIDVAEDRKLFAEAMADIGLETPFSIIVDDKSDLNKIVNEVSFPLILRPFYTLGGTGGGIVYDKDEFIFKVKNAIDLSPVSKTLVEESLIGWKEFEFEVVRDQLDNSIIVCSIENLDPMGIHTGDSITIAPALTLTDKEYQKLRNQSIAILRKIGVETGGSNVQFAVNPKNGKILIIEMNPRVSRSSALASKATGFPIAKIAALLAVGYTLDELENDITKVTPASFEPVIDYIVTKIPKFNFEKFQGTPSELNTAMKSVGEIMSIGRTFKESLLKAFYSIESDNFGLDISHELLNHKDENLKNLLTKQRPDRLLIVAEAIRRKISLNEISELTHIDLFFLREINEIINIEQLLVKAGNNLDKNLFTLAKKTGFSNHHISNLTKINIDKIYILQKNNNLKIIFKRVDTCGNEFDSSTAYLYSTFSSEINEFSCESRPVDKKKIIILGSGPNRIGQGIEFDYCCVQAVKSFQKLGYETIMINCNPETVSTDYDTSDKLYFEPLDFEYVKNIIDKENETGVVEGVIVQFGGQTPLRIANKLKEYGYKILGTSFEAIDISEDRERFQKLISKVGLKQPKSDISLGTKELVAKSSKLKFPILLRPSYVLGGRMMEKMAHLDDVQDYIDQNYWALENNVILIDEFLQNAKEVDVDVLRDSQGNTMIAGIMEHIEEAGIHSGDSACSIPPFSLNDKVISNIKKFSISLATELKTLGLMNIQYAIKDDEIYILEANPRASRTIPFLAKAIGIPFIKIAAELIVGEILSKEYQEFDNSSLPYFAIKEAVFPFNKFPNTDVILGPEMKSTGEVMGIDEDFYLAYLKSQIGAGQKLNDIENIFISVKDEDKQSISEMAKSFTDNGYNLFSTKGTHDYLMKEGISSNLVNKVAEGSPHVVEYIKDNKIDLVINTTEDKQAIIDSFTIRRTSVDLNVPYYTNLRSAKILIKSLITLKNKPISVKPIQIHHSF
ncbi:carbamoyl-phosphate synthase large subunit [Alphaproteobacteria bacterium]|nr:carbamoyl-phosphate synthase large subunit [Alphaproteobacteria bacterium]